TFEIIQITLSFQLCALNYLSEIYAKSYKPFMADTSNQYNDQIEKCRELFINKMHDYGSAWRILRLPSLTDQIFIKAQRIRGLQKNAEQKIAENETSEFIGIVNLSIIALILLVRGIADHTDL